MESEIAKDRLGSWEVKMEIDSRLYQQVGEKKGLAPGQLDPGQPLKAISNFCDEEGMYLIRGYMVC